MTAVAPPPTFQNISRQAWTGANGVPNGATSPVTTDDLRMFMPRKSAQRSNSSSSLASQASSSSTLSAASSQANGSAPAPAPVGEGATWAGRKKAPRGLWPASKTEPISGISTARPQSIASATSGPSATSAMTALHSPAAPMVPSQHNSTSPSQQNGSAPRPQPQESQAILHLIPMNGTFERKTITVPFFPDVLRIGRQTNNKTIPTPLNGYFDSKVLSRQHAEIWADRNGKIWIRDVKSSNGTFVNGQRLSQENRDSEPHELRAQDMLELGIDIVSEDQKTIVHHKVAAQVEHAGIYSNAGGNLLDVNFGELEGPQMSSLVGPGGQQQLANMRGRTPSQGSMNSQRLQGPPGSMGNNVNSMQQQQRHPNFWLQPITMEQVVKKLNSEMKAAKQQSQDLQHTHQYINAILTADPKKENKSPVNPVKVSPIKDMNLKARFTDPPAPPPQQPLPEKPDAHSSLKRSETERPKLGSPIRSDAQMSTLTEALSSAKKEIESQGVRLRDLETLLREERRAREDAEERASRLERESIKEPEDVSAEPIMANGDIHKPEGPSQPESDQANEGEQAADSSNIADVATSRLQQRLDSMMSEMNEMKQQMERYRERAETAEADRKSLAEMIENIRQDNASRAGKDGGRVGRVDEAPSRDGCTSPELGGSEEGDGAEEGEITIIRDKDVEEDGVGALRRAALHNARPVDHEDAADPAKSAHALATRPSNRHDLALAHGAPAVSIITVVAIGVAVMAWLNQYPKVER